MESHVPPVVIVDPVRVDVVAVAVLFLFCAWLLLSLFATVRKRELRCTIEGRPEAADDDTSRSRHGFRWVILRNTREGEVYIA